MSDPVTGIPTLDERVGDLLAVLDAAKVGRVVLGAASESGPVAILFAVVHPERVHSLVVIQTAARFRQDLPDFPWGFTDAEVDDQLADIDHHWGEGALAEVFLGAASGIPGVRAEVGRFQRSLSSPTSALMLWKETMATDVRKY